MVAPIVNTGIQTAKVRIPGYICQMRFIDCDYSSIAMVRGLHTGVYTISSGICAVAGLGVLVGLQIMDNIPSYAS
jgi:hypothetical protein